MHKPRPPLSISASVLSVPSPPQVYPLLAFPDPAIAQASERMVQEHQAKYLQTSRVLQQVPQTYSVFIRPAHPVSVKRNLGTINDYLSIYPSIYPSLYPSLYPILYPVYTQYIPRVFPAYTLSIPCLYPVYTSLYPVYTNSIPTLYQLYTQSIPSLYPVYTQDAHEAFLPVYLSLTLSCLCIHSDRQWS